MNSDKKQLILIFILLAVLVILPTACMLWFVVRAVQNEQLAVKQRLVDKYKNEVRSKLHSELSGQWLDEFGKVQSLFKQQDDNGKDLCRQVIDQSDIVFDYVYPFGRSGKHIIREEDFSEDASDIFEVAQRLEFEVFELVEAVKEYSRLASEAPEYAGPAILGHIRCLRKLGKLREAIDLCQGVMGDKGDHSNKSKRHYWQMKLLLVEMYAQTGRDELEKEIVELTQCAFEQLPYDAKLFILGRAVELIEENKLQEKLSSSLRVARKELQCIEVMLSVKEKYSTGYTGEMGFHSVEDVKFNKDVYVCIGEKTAQGHLLYCVIDADRLKVSINDYLLGLTDDMIFINLFDPSGRLVGGEDMHRDFDFSDRNQHRETIFIDNMSYPFGGWELWVAFRPGVFGVAADSYKMAYIWLAVLVLFLAAICATLVSRLLLSQARVNHLKNDFIATVTHELKTPLTSAKMLVDTLLDGKYTDQKLVLDYLEIISSENTRLISLVDNFLTFSRMERARQAFDKEVVDINELVSAAAVMFNHKDSKEVEFSVSKCPQKVLVLVDKQAMLTVILNLLSNAWKYNDKEPKIIELSVYEGDAGVSLAVKDNGIGLSVRQQKKVFERFYRVDDSLARCAEGTGIGLTIVKFIVESHGGTISVKSKPEAGSEFVVHLKT